MTNNTINVPRELLERASNLAFQTQHYPMHEELRTLLSAPSPAGVDWLELDRNEAYQACPDSGCDWGSFWQGWKARHAGAKAIIDGLRGEVEVMTQHANNYSRMFEECAEERDQQSQRIGELEGLLRESGKTIHKLQAEQPTPARIARYLDAMRAEIDATLSAGKDYDQ